MGTGEGGEGNSWKSEWIGDDGCVCGGVLGEQWRGRR